MHVSVCVCVYCSACVEVREQPARVRSLFPSCESQGLNQAAGHGDKSLTLDCLTCHSISPFDRRESLRTTWLEILYLQVFSILYGLNGMKETTWEKGRSSFWCSLIHCVQQGGTFSVAARCESRHNPASHGLFLCLSIARSKWLVP